VTNSIGFGEVLQGQEAQVQNHGYEVLAATTVEVDLKRTSLVGLKATGLMDSKHQVRGVRPLPLPLPARTGHQSGGTAKATGLDRVRGGGAGGAAGACLHGASFMRLPLACCLRLRTGAASQLLLPAFALRAASAFCLWCGSDFGRAACSGVAGRRAGNRIGSTRRDIDLDWNWSRASFCLPALFFLPARAILFCQPAPFLSASPPFFSASPRLSFLLARLLPVW